MFSEKRLKEDSDLLAQIQHLEFKRNGRGLTEEEKQELVKLQWRYTVENSMIRLFYKLY